MEHFLQLAKVESKINWWGVQNAYLACVVLLQPIIEPVKLFPAKLLQNYHSIHLLDHKSSS